MMKIVMMFDRGSDSAELSDVLELVTDAWELFPSFGYRRQSSGRDEISLLIDKLCTHYHPPKLPFLSTLISNASQEPHRRRRW